MHQVIREVLKVAAELDFLQILRLIQLLVNQSHGANTVLALSEYLDGLRILPALRLEIEETAYDLQIVLDTVMDLLKQRLLVP
jgi:hypothetical protein